MPYDPGEQGHLVHAKDPAKKMRKTSAHMIEASQQEQSHRKTMGVLGVNQGEVEKGIEGAMRTVPHSHSGTLYPPYSLMI
jgi:hypothetical protein